MNFVLDLAIEFSLLKKKKKKDEFDSTQLYKLMFTF